MQIAQPSPSGGRINAQVPRIGLLGHTSRLAAKNVHASHETSA